MSENLKDIKKSLENALGPANFERYLKLLRKWFSLNLTKEQFDNEARKLISREKEHIHNEFFVAILSKCSVSPLSGSLQQSGASASSSTGPKKRKGLQALKKLISKGSSHNHDKRFRPSEPIQTVQPSVQSKNVQDPPTSIPDNAIVCAKDGLLPNRSAMFGRALVIAWEAGLDDVDERSVDLLVLATRDMLKNVLQAAIQLRRNFVLADSRFPHLFGVDSSLTLAGGDSRRGGAVSRIDPDFLQCVAATRSRPQQKISLRDIYDGLKVRPDVLPCQTVTAVVMERILCKLEDESDSGDGEAKKPRV